MRVILRRHVGFGCKRMLERLKRLNRLWVRCVIVLGCQIAVRPP